MKTPNADNLYLGAGDVYFDRFDSNGNSTGLRHMGNVDSLELQPSTETKDKKSSMSGTRAVLKEVVVSATADVTIELSEFDKDNLALALLGTSAFVTQAAVASVTDHAINGGQPIALDVFYDLGAFNPTVTDVKQGSTALNPAAYELDTEVGMIRFLSSYTGTGAATATAATWDGSIPALVQADGVKIVQGLNTTQIQGHLRFVSAKDQASGPRQVLDVWNMNVNPDGALQLISEDFATYKLKGKVLQAANKPAGQQYFSLRDLPSHQLGQ